MRPIQPSTGAVSLLVAEDDRTVRDLLRVIIPKKFPDAVLYLAEDGRAGVDLFKKHRPQIVITDINMPVMDGIEMAREIRQIKAGVKIIVLSAYDGPAFCDRFEDIGFESYLVKPISFDELFDAIESCR